MPKKSKDSIEKNLQNKWGAKAAIKASNGDLTINEKNHYSSGSKAVNFALSGHHKLGFRRSRLVEIYGPNMVGKTTLLLHILAEAQKKGEKVGLIDAERALDLRYASRILDLNKLYVVTPYCGEDAFEMSWDLLNQGIKVIGYDSIPAMKPRANADGTMDDKHMGDHAKLIGDGLQKAAQYFSESDGLGIFINQIRMKIGVFFGNPETTPGGEGKNFYFSYRLDLRSKRSNKIEESKTFNEAFGKGQQEEDQETPYEIEVRKIKESKISAVGKKKALKKLKSKQIKGKKNTIETGKVVDFTVAKNKLFPPFRKASYRIDYGAGINNYEDTLELFNSIGIISGFEIGKKKLTYGPKNYTVAKFKNMIQENKLKSEIVEKIKKYYENM